MIQSRARTLRTQRLLGSDASEFFAEGRGPCVVAFHGFTGSASELRPLLDTLAAQGRAVRAPLLAGHGTTVEQLQDARFEDWVSGMRAHVDEAIASYGRVVFVGFSLGSLVAMHLAAQKPKGLVGLVVLGNALRLRAFSSIPLAIADRFGLALPDAYMMKIRAADMIDRDAAARITTYDRLPLRAAHEVYRAGRRVRGEVYGIEVPTLILHSKRDLVCHPAGAAWLRANIGAADVTLRIFPKSAHVLAADIERDDVAADVTAFLDRVAPLTG